MEGPVFVPRRDATAASRAEIGGKAAALAALSRLAAEPGAGFRVPRWVAIGAEAFEAARRVATGKGPFAVHPTLRTALRRALAEAGLLDSRLAVRSSEAAEDSASASFAGQFDSVLGVAAGDEDALWDAVRRVWASAFSAHATAYRERRAADSGPAARMAVVVQEMVDPAAAGVAFSADPVTGDRGVAVVSAVPGLGEGLVSGDLDADTFRVAFEGGGPRLVERRIVPKKRAIRMTATGTSAEPIGDGSRGEPAVTDDEAIAVAACAKRLEAALGAPQDVEWALARSAGSTELVILQARPITTLPTVAATDSPGPGDGAHGEQRIWDNSNIIESYSGVTTPLTFSFARAVYEDVYRQFCRVMGVPEPLLAALASLPSGTHRVLLDPGGRPFDQDGARRLAALGDVALVCGRYEGFDDRIRRHVDEEVSLGDFVLSGGEVAAMAIVEAAVRLVPGVLGNAESPMQESFAQGPLLEYPQYTRPADLAGELVPEVLLSGDHAKVAAWRRGEAIARTRARRPELVPRLVAAGLCPRPVLHVALVHHPVLDRAGDVVTTSLTNLDVHDLARTARTYGAAALHVVTPIALQRELVDRIVAVWTEGPEGERLPERKEALCRVRADSNLEEAIASTRGRGPAPFVVTTSAAGRLGAVPAERVLALAGERPLLVVFGTGHGLAPEVHARADAVLAPVLGADTWNHLSVRAASAIVLDRIFRS